MQIRVDSRDACWSAVKIISGYKNIRHFVVDVFIVAQIGR